MKECHGNLVDIGLPKLLHLIYKRNDAFGVLNISREPIKKRFFFSGGKPVFATSNILGEVLGRLLMLEGIITQSDYEKSLEVVLKENRRHGEVLTSMGLITDAELDNFLYLQLKRRAWKIFGWNEGTYQYETIESLPTGATPMPLHPAKMILDGISLGFYPLARIKEDLDTYLNTVMVPALKSTRYKIEDFGLNIQEARFFEKFDGTATVSEVLDGSFLLKQRALSLTLVLIMTGALAKPGEESAQDELKLIDEPEHNVGISTAPGSKLNAELLFMRAKSDFAKSNFKSALDTLKQIVEINPMEGEYWAWFGWTLYNSDRSKMNEAEKIIKDAIDLNNELDGAWYFLARIFFEQGDHEAAKNAYITACNKNQWMLEAVAELKRIEIQDSSVSGANAGNRCGYMDSFSFTLDPFSALPDDRFKITTSGQTETLETTLLAIAKKEGPIIIEATKGSGKTTLLLDLLQKLSNKKTLAAVILSPAKKELELIKKINMELHATTVSNSIKEQLLSLGMRVSQNNSQGGSTIIVLDRADELTTGCLKLVQYLARLKSLQLILVGRTGISKRLDAPDFAELNRKALVRLDIEPLTVAETGEFFRKRVSAIPLTPPTTARPALDHRALELLNKKSGGNPEEIIRYCALLLDAAADEKKTVIGAALAATVLSIELSEATEEVAEKELELIEVDPVEASGVAPGIDPKKDSGEISLKTDENSYGSELILADDEEIEKSDIDEEIETLDTEPVDPKELIVETEPVERNEPDLGLLEDVIETAGKKGAQQQAEKPSAEKITATEPDEPATPEETIAAGTKTETKERPATEESAAGEEPAEKVEVEAAQKGPKKKGGLTRILLIIVLMIVLGLAAGSLVNQYLLGQ